MTTGVLPPLLLLVEDHEDARELYAEFLQLSGFRVASAADGEEAVRLARALLPDVVVMDFSLPGLDGREATRRLRADPRTARIPIVILSGMPAEIARTAGGDAHVAKPSSPEALVATVQGLLGRGRA
jgi:CheY-like chemotaxis protein